MTVCRSPRNPRCQSTAITHTYRPGGVARPLPVCADCADDLTDALNRQQARLDRRRPQRITGGNP